MDMSAIDSLSSAKLKEQLTAWRYKYKWPKDVFTVKDFAVGKFDGMTEKPSWALRLKTVLDVALALDVDGQLVPPSPQSRGDNPSPLLTNSSTAAPIAHPRPTLNFVATRLL